MILDGENQGGEGCLHIHVYRQNVPNNANKFYVRCESCDDILDTVTFEVNPVPQDSHTRMIKRHFREHRRPSSSQRLDSVGHENC